MAEPTTATGNMTEPTAATDNTAEPTKATDDTAELTKAPDVAEPATATDNIGVEVEITDSNYKDVSKGEEAETPIVHETKTFDSEATSDANDNDSKESETAGAEGTFSKEPPANSRSSEVHGLFEKFQAYKEKKDHLIHALIAEHASLMLLNSNRMLVTKQAADLAEGTVIAGNIGTVPVTEELSTEVNEASYSAIQSLISNNYKMHEETFKKNILDCAVESNTVVTNKVAFAIAKCDELEKSYNHYLKKVAALHASSHRFVTQGKELKGRKAEKLKRNEGKLLRARTEYETFATKLCDFLDEVTLGGWKDLYLLLIKLSELNLSRVADESKVLPDLERVLTSLKATAQENGVLTDSRLNDLEAMYPDISIPPSPTKPGKGKSARNLIASNK